MISFSNTKIAGRLGRDPDIRVTTSGKKVATLSVAVDIGYGDRRQTQWYSVVVWEKTAEYAESHLHKGDVVYVDGTSRSREYENSNGEKRTVWEIQGRELQAIYNSTEKQGNFEVIDDDEDLPF